METPDKISNNLGNILEWIWRIIALPLGAYLHHIWAKRRWREEIAIQKTTATENKLRDASIDLKNAFSGIMYWLENEAATDKFHTAGKLRSTEKNIDDAILKFRAILPEDKISAFDIACKTFFNTDEEKKIKYYNYARTSDKKEAAEQAMKNIKIILEFTKF